MTTLPIVMWLGFREQIWRVDFLLVKSTFHQETVKLFSFVVEVYVFFPGFANLYHSLWLQEAERKIPINNASHFKASSQGSGKSKCV